MLLRVPFGVLQVCLMDVCINEWACEFFFFPFLSLDFSSFFFFSFLKKKFGEDLTKSWIVWIGLMIKRDVMFVWIADFWIWQSVDVDEMNIVLKNWTFWFLYGFDEKLYLIFKIRVDTSLKIKDFVFLRI